MKYFISSVGLFLIPVFMFVGVYLVKDPFKVLYKYASYYTSDKNDYISFDRDYVSTQNYLDKRHQYPYDSYILGNSRSEFYPVNVWAPYVHATDCYHFDAYGESLQGIEEKMNLLDKEGATINNVLFVIDSEVFKCAYTQTGPVRSKHPKLSGENLLAFQFRFFSFYCNKDFFWAYMSILFHKKPSINRDVLSSYVYHYVPETNELSFKCYEDIIAKNPQDFYGPRMHWFYKRDTVLRYGMPVIGDEQKRLLGHISAILKTHHTAYKIVISPLYDQLKFNTADLNILYQMFGKENVFDFSGINDITNDYTNYYEESHYRTKVAVRVLDSVYGKKTALVAHP